MWTRDNTRTHIIIHFEREREREKSKTILLNDGGKKKLTYKNAGPFAFDSSLARVDAIAIFAGVPDTVWLVAARYAKADGRYAVVRDAAAAVPYVVVRDGEAAAEEAPPPPIHSWSPLADADG